MKKVLAMTLVLLTGSAFGANFQTDLKVGLCFLRKRV